jgi:acetamidase/formamidase
VTRHAYDNYERMIKSAPGVESIYYWDQTRKGVNRRGAGEGLGVHICTGPVAIKGAEPGDILEVRILAVKPRPCANPAYQGKSFGSNAAAWWGFHYHDLLEAPKPREVITIYEVDATGERDWEGGEPRSPQPRSRGDGRSP